MHVYGMDDLELGFYHWYDIKSEESVWFVLKLSHDALPAWYREGQKAECLFCSFFSFFSFFCSFHFDSL